jgi:phthiodiolone/phenolphthiodiolone dimycocerosates ketoreductase
VATPKIATGVILPTVAPLGLNRTLVYYCRLAGLDSVLLNDHFQAFVPTAIWDEDFSWRATPGSSFHTFFDYQTLLGYLASSAGRMSVGIGVTEPIRRHPVLIAQAMLTLSHMAKRPPILGIGSGERQNIEPYGLDFSHPVGRLEEALKIIRLCFSSQGPIDFEGSHYHLDGAVMDLKAPKRKTPKIWIAAHGPRMLRLTGQYADGWFPHLVASPEEYAEKLDAIRAAAEEAGRDPQAITPALDQYTMVAPTVQEARALLETKFGRYASGLLFASAEEWRKVGAEHSFGEHYGGPSDIVPERYDRKTLEEGIATVPPELIGYGFLWGTPERVAEKLRAFGEVGLRHAVVVSWSTMVSRRAAIYGLRATRRIARLLREDQRS